MIAIKKKKIKDTAADTVKTPRRSCDERKSEAGKKRKRVPNKRFSPSEFHAAKKKLLPKKSKKESKVMKKKTAQKFSPLIRQNRESKDTNFLADTSDESSSITSSDEIADAKHRKKDLKVLKELQIKTEHSLNYKNSSHRDEGTENFAKSSSFMKKRNKSKEIDDLEPNLVINLSEESDNLLHDKTTTYEIENDENAIACDAGYNSSDEDITKAKKSSTSVPENVKQNISSEDQLYGKDWPNEKMIELIDEIYCRERIYESALSGAKQVTHLARRLLEGVIKTEMFVHLTLTGQRPRAQGKPQTDVFCINLKAKKAITDFAMKKGIECGWPIPTQATVDRSLTTKIGDLKATILRNK